MRNTEILESRGDLEASMARANHNHSGIAISKVNLPTASLCPGTMFGSLPAERANLHLGVISSLAFHGSIGTAPARGSH